MRAQSPLTIDQVILRQLRLFCETTHLTAAFRTFRTNALAEAATGVLYKKVFLKFYCRIDSKKPVLESFFNKVEGFRPKKADPVTSVFL